MARRQDVPRDRARQTLTNLLGGIPSQYLLTARDSVTRDIGEAHTAKGYAEIVDMRDMLDQAYRESLRNEEVRGVLN